jgi:integrase
MFVTAVVTGLRQGELVALPWSNVTPEGVRVDRTWSRDEIVGYDTPKTRHAYRTVPISTDVYAMLLERHRLTGGELVFPTEAGTMGSPWNVHRAFVHFMRAHNAALAEGQDALAIPRIRFHDLRRVAATLWARQGAEPKVIQQLLGHATPHLALSVYQGVLDERVEAARLDARRLFGGYALSPGFTGGGAGDGVSRVLERPVN